MCKWLKSGANRIDPCMKNKLSMLSEISIPVLACCCGHGRYPETIIVDSPTGIYELNSGIKIPRKKRFYVKDKEGHYHIPEMSFPLMELPDCWMQYYNTVLCEKCPVGKLCAEMKAWDDME